MALPNGTQVFAPTWRGNYPAMAREDLPIWDRWINAHFHEGWDGFAYNVRLGGRQAPQGTDPQAAAMWSDVTAKRIDALGIKPDSLTIIEVRRGAKGSAVGQLLQYDALWRSLGIDDRPVSLMLLTDDAEADLAVLAHLQGIDLVEV